MSDPFIGEIRIFGGNFAPVGWEFCNGQLLPISENDVLFALLGTTYGGDGQSTFALPDLRGRLPIHMGAGSGLTPRVAGQAGGTETVTLSTPQLPAHAHGPVTASQVTPSTGVAVGNLTAQDDVERYSSTQTVTMAPGTVTPTGGSQPHDNLQPYLCVNFIISTQGIFPSRN